MEDRTTPESSAERVSLSTDDELLREKLESLAEFAAGAGHEINNPLATIIGRAELLLKNETDPERRRALTTIGGQALRVRDMIGDLMLFARPPEPACEPANLAAAIDAVVNNLRESIAAANADVQTVSEADVVLRADPRQLQIVIAELLRNSLNALPDTGGRGRGGLGIGRRAWKRVPDHRRQRARLQRTRSAPLVRSLLFRPPGGSGFGLRALQMLADRVQSQRSH